MRIWIDVENPPQVQYLLPLKPALERRGAEVVVTARDYGNTFELLQQANASFTPVGHSYGAGKARKVVGLAGRTRSLLAHFRHTGRPDASVSASRAAAVVTRLQRRPAFAIVDYEYVSLAVFRLTGARILHPAVIPAARFTSRGIHGDRLLPFHGLKEDLSFAGIELAAIPAHPLPAPADVVRVLLRPAAEESHYYRDESGRMTTALYERLSSDEGAVVVFAPRYPRQVAELERFSWKRDPVVLEQAVPFVSLLKAVDLVVSSGGTMLREAAYLGVPAYSLFQGDVGAVDGYLEELGRLSLLRVPADFEEIKLERAQPLEPLAQNPGLVDELAERVVAAARRHSPDG